DQSSPAHLLTDLFLINCLFARDHHRSLVLIGFAPRVARLPRERPRMDSGSAASSSSSGAMVLPSKASSGEGGGTDSPAAVASSSTASISSSTASISSSSGVIEASLCVTTRGAQEQLRQQGPRRVSSPILFVGHQQQPLPYPPDAQVISFPEPYPGESDPLGFGLGSVADGTFGGRKATPEELMLFRSHRLLQAEAVGVAIGPLHSSGGADAGYVRKRLGLVSTAVERQLRLKVLEQTNAAVEGVRALGEGAPPAQQQSVINAERRNCHRVLSGVLDEGTATLRELSTTGGGGLGGVSVDMGMSMAFPPSALGSPATESQQLASTWEDAATSSSMNSSSSNSIGSSCLTSMQLQQQPQRQQQQHQQSILHHMPPGTGRSSVFALTQMRDRPQHHHSQLGMALGNTRMEGAGGMKQQGMGASFGSGGGAAAPQGHNHGGLSDPSAGFDGNSWGVTGGGASVGGGGGGKRATSNVGKAKKRSGLLKKTPPSDALTDPRRPVYNNRKGSRHRLTPQAKEILEGWLAKHWLNPYPTEEQKLFLAQNCHITVTQVNNWMMNVRVRRCRTKKIGLATGPEEITYTAAGKATPKALAANRVVGRSSSSSSTAAAAPASSTKQEGGGGASGVAADAMPLRRMLAQKNSHSASARDGVGADAPTSTPG
ncbi:unnamed protein product, partial [Ectocarpus sp. 4 AP-2014]